MRRRGEPAKAAPETRPVSEIVSDKLQPISATPGVYLLLDERGVCVYVGQSVNVRQRLEAHRLVAYDIAQMLPAADAKARQGLEWQLIRLLRPKLNTYAGNPAVLETSYNRAEERAKLEAAQALGYSRP